eukprot:tig00000123_g6914.t1
MHPTALGTRRRAPTPRIQHKIKESSLWHERGATAELRRPGGGSRSRRTAGEAGLSSRKLRIDRRERAKGAEKELSFSIEAPERRQQQPEQRALLEIER